MKRLRMIILNAICIVFVTACSDFLKEKSQDEVIPKTVKDYGEMLLPYLQSSIDKMVYSMDDDVAIDEKQFWGNEESYDALRLRARFTWQPDMWEEDNSDMSASIYTNAYTIIRSVNAILEGLDEASGSEEEREMVRARSLGIRAYVYFILVNLYGEPYNYNKEALGVPLKLTSVYIAEGIARSTVEEVYTQIVADLEKASSIFMKYPKRRGDYLINGTATDILLSRVYLHMGKWLKVIEAADRAIKSSEGLWDYTALGDDRYYITSYDNPEVEWLFMEIKIDKLLMPSDDLLILFDENDRRPEFFIKVPFPGGIGKLDVEEGYGPATMIRSAEAYLNRAEAKVLVENADFVGALSDLNELRRHRITGYQDVDISDPKELLEEIRKERRLELCFEGHRWYDLRRYGMPAISHDFKTLKTDPWKTYLLKEKDPLYTLPFPVSILRNNIKLEQNISANEAKRNGVPKI